jgi:FMN phosphatase YigB (HAD superfamily)
MSPVKDSILKRPPGEGGGGAPGYSAVIFDLFITLTDFDAEHRRPTMNSQLAEALGVDGDTFVSSMRESFTERTSGQLGDLPATLRALCLRLGAVPTAAQVSNAVSPRFAHEMELTQPRAGVLEVLATLRARGGRRKQ